MKYVVAIVSALMVLHFNYGGGLPFSGSDTYPVLLVQDVPAETEPEKDKKSADEAKPRANIIKSPNLTLKLAFMADPRLFPYEIECHVQNKSVELKGVVTLEKEKTLAAIVAGNVIEGKDILNHIEVQPSLNATLAAKSNARLTDLVKQRFEKSQTLREANFEVTTIRGVVSLRGQTRFQVIALEAAQAAREIPGVVAVDTKNIRLEAEIE